MPAAETVRTPAPPAERMVDALTWAHNLSAGDVVRPEDVVWTKVPARLVPHDAERDPDAVVGQAARRALREGAPAAVHDLAPPRVIRRDQDVEVVFLQDGIRLVLTGRALADAAVGDPVAGAQHPVQEDHRRGRVGARPGGHRTRRPELAKSTILAALP